MQERTVYLLLTRSSTWVSRLIHFATGDMYTHVSIGLDGPQGAFYSFGRKYRYLALPGGLVMESAVARLGTTPCCLCKLSISDAMYLQLHQQICSMYTQRKEYHYNLLGLFACFFNLSVSRSRPLLLLPVCGYNTGGLRSHSSAKTSGTVPPSGLLPDRGAANGIPGASKWDFCLEKHRGGGLLGCRLFFCDRGENQLLNRCIYWCQFSMQEETLKKGDSSYGKRNHQ